MIRNKLIFAALAGAAVFSTAAQAQFYWGPFGPRPPIVDDDYFRHPPGRIPEPYRSPYVEDAYNSGEIIGILRDEGFRSIATPRRNGGVFVTTAIDPRGQRVRVVVGAYDGDIRSVTAAAPEKPRVAATPNPPAIDTPAGPATAPPAANPLNGGGSTGAPPTARPAPQARPAQPGTQAARPVPVDPKKPDRVILPNPSSGTAGLPPPVIAPAPAPAPQTAPQIATPSVPPVPAPTVPVTPPAITPPPVAPPEAPAKAPETEILALPPATAQ